MVKKIILLSFSYVIFCETANSQSLIDISTGTSFQDQFAAQLTYRKQFSDNFRAGIELQYGSVKERFVEAQLIEEGYATSISIPMSLLLSKEEKIQLFGTFKAGIRFQGIIDPDGNNRRDSTLNSTALIGELGFLALVKASDNLYFQGGVSFPVGFELSPSSLFEYQWTNLHVGMSFKARENILFLKGNLGPAFGASGDTYKFMWALQGGIRINLTPDKHPFSANFIEASL